MEQEFEFCQDSDAKKNKGATVWVRYPETVRHWMFGLARNLLFVWYSLRKKRTHFKLHWHILKLLQALLYYWNVGCSNGNPLCLPTLIRKRSCLLGEHAENRILRFCYLHTGDGRRGERVSQAMQNAWRKEKDGETKKGVVQVWWCRGGGGVADRSATQIV